MTAGDPVRKNCNCGAGDDRALEVLRATSLADLPQEEFQELVDAVKKAGGIKASNGLPRVLITKAIHEFNEGVAKGDYVGHPFRGNQHTDASGASRGGSGGPKRTSTGRTERRRAGRFTAEEQRLAALNEQLSGQVNPAPEGFYDLMEQDARITARVEAEAFVQSMVEQQGEESEAAVDKAIRGQETMVSIARGAADRADMEYEQGQMTDADEDTMFSLGLAKRVRNEVVRLANDVKRALESSKKQVSRATAAIRQNGRDGVDAASSRIKDARTALLKLDAQLQRTSDRYRSMGRYGGGHSGASGNLSMMRAAIREGLDALGDFAIEINNMPDAALEVEREILAERDR